MLPKLVRLAQKTVFQGSNNMTREKRFSVNERHNCPMSK